MHEGATGSRDEPDGRRHTNALPRCPCSRELDLRVPLAHQVAAQVGRRERRGGPQQPCAEVQRFQERAIHVGCVRGIRGGSNAR